jgi:hypothetical protein
MTEVSSLTSREGSKSRKNQRLLPYWSHNGLPKLCKLCPTPVYDSFDGCLFRLCLNHLRIKYKDRNRARRLRKLPEKLAKVFAPPKRLKDCPDRYSKQEPFAHLTPEQQELAWKIYQQYEHRYQNQGALIGFCTSAALAGGVRQRGLNSNNRKKLRTFYTNYVNNGCHKLNQGRQNNA